MDKTAADIDQAIGANISKWRALAGHTQKSFGEACMKPISAQQVSKYESGENKVNSARLVDFAITLNCPVMAFFAGIWEDYEPIKAVRADSSLMQQYQTLPPSLRNSVRALVQSMAKELSDRGKLNGS